jgi:serine phosphatase RsbU (regulator of sigma subunit)
MFVKNKNRRNSILIALLFFIFFLTLSIIRNNYIPKNRAPKESGVSGGLEQDTLKILPKNWKYHSGDNLVWAKKEVNDSLWQLLNPELNLNKIPKNTFNGICWFRVQFSIDSSHINEVFALSFDHYGASEVYFDGNLLDKFGTVSDNKINEEGAIPNAPVYFSVSDTKTHNFSIRYSNQSFNLYYTKYNETCAGLKNIVAIANPGRAYVGAVLFENLWLPIILLFGFFGTLSLVHFLLFIFYRKQIQNLYFSIFVFVFALLTYSLYMLSHSKTPETRMLIQHYYIAFLGVVFLISITLCVHSLFKPILAKRILFIAIMISILTLLSLFIPVLADYSDNLVFIFIFFTTIESVRSVIFGLKHKMPGAKIIGTGVLVFFLFIAIFLIESILLGDSFTIKFGTSDATTYFIILLVLCIISIPLSMSIYLARNFAVTNNHLAQKLIEVEDLSSKSIAQEKEKQQILANQNITLEKQVTERTLEITEQKKVIEEKNKDIIDSINYAKRIQSAMLPDEHAFKAIFNNSFVLYMPRDIVSGDFYYASEFNGDKLIIAADCTGHGVPGALMSMVGCNIINKLAHEDKIIEPKKILENLHTQLRQALKQDMSGSLNRDGMDVAAVLIKDNEIIFASANRPLIYFDKQHQLIEIKATKTPIGGSHIESVNVEQHIISKENIKQLFLFSDGFADQFGGPDGKKLMVSKFKLWLSQIINLEPEEQHLFLQKNFIAWKQESEQVDDVLVVGIKL